MNRKYFLIATLISVVLLTVVLVPISSQPSGSYDPWMDLNDDGIVDSFDLQLLAWIYGTSGTPINKTELLLELQARIDSLNVSLLNDYYNITECDSLFQPLMQTTTRYYKVPAIAWLPRQENYVFTRISPCLYTTTAGATYWFAAVNLPHGAVVTELKAWVWDDDASEISVYLMRHEAGTSTVNQMSYVGSSGASPSYRAFTDSTISYSIIDNQNYAYLVRAILRSGNSDHRLGQVQITYTIDEPLP